MDQAAIEEMDQDAAEETTNNPHLDLGTKFSLELSLMGFDDAEDEADFGNEEVELNWFLARLPVSTTLTELEIGFVNYDRSHRDNRRTAQPICDCLANLWREYHPLRKLKLCSTIDEDDAQLASTQRCPSTILYRCETIRDRPPEVGQCTLYFWSSSVTDTVI